jgi:hypothetical protein
MTCIGCGMLQQHTAGLGLSPEDLPTWPPEPPGRMPPPIPPKRHPPDDDDVPETPPDEPGPVPVQDPPAEPDPPPMVV